jgi:hypothetical protein
MYSILELIRLEEDSQYGTFGVLKINKQVFCVTLELQDLENRSNKSSIPAQQYWMERIESSKFGKTFEIIDVPDRSHILFHSGNIVSETKGCIILAQHYGLIKHRRGVLCSGSTFKRFMIALADHDYAHLTIREVY